MRFDRWFHVVLLRMRSLFRRCKVEQELDEELRYHLERQIEQNIANGLTVQEARYAALRAMAGIEQRKEECRDTRRVSFIYDFLQDLRYGLRVLQKNPGFTAVAIVSLALGIGANSAIFSVLNALMLRSLPVHAPEELSFVRRNTSGLRFSYPMFEQFRNAVTKEDSLAAMSRLARMRVLVDGKLESEIAGVQLVSGEFSSVMGVTPAIGRVLGVEDNRVIGGHPVAVISDGFWRRSFGAANDVLGRGLTINGTHFTIVGVAARGFEGVWLESPTDVWIPLVMQDDVRYAQNFSADHADLNRPWLPQNTIWWLDLIVREKGRRGAITGALNTVFAQSNRPLAETIGDLTQRERLLRQRLVLDPFERGFSDLRQRFRSPLVALMAMVGLLLLIACANTANMLLARASARQHEIAVRLSIGASRSRLVRQLLTEGLLLGILAGVVGLLFAPWASDLLVRSSMEISSGPSPFSANIDTNVLAFTAILSLAITLVFALAPAFRATRVELAGGLKRAGRGVPAGARLNTAKMLVVFQVTLSLLLVVSAGLFIRNLRNLSHINPGFDPEHVISVWIGFGAVQRENPRPGAYTRAELPGLYRRLIERVETVPRVISASLAMCGLAAECRANNDGIVVSGYERAPGERILIQENRVGVRYFSTVGMRLLAGRDFTDRDVDGAPNVAIVNEAMVRRYFSNGSAVGQRFGSEKADTEIIGIVEDARVNTVREAAVPMAYYPIEQPAAPAGSLDVRTTSDPHLIVNDLRKAVLEVDANLPIDRITTLDDQVSSNLNAERFVARLTSTFGAVALGLACFGLYGVMSYAVARRRAEFGIRIALGATQSRLLWMVFRESLLLVGFGLAIGMPLVLVTFHFLSALLLGIHSTDPATLVLTTLILVSVASLSAFLPAWRASRIDPMVALRHE